MLKFASLAHAEIYRCVDANSKPRYQDKPCAEGEQSLKIDQDKRHRKSVDVNTDRFAFNDAEQNRIQNAQFDQNLDFWLPRQSSQAFTWVGDDGHQQSGALSVRTNPPANPQKNVIYEETLAQCVKLDRGRRYRFAASFKAKGSYLSPHANRVNLYWYQSEDCSTYGQFADYLEPKPNVVGWQRITRDDALRSLNAKAALITIVQAQIGGNKQPAYWDDIELTPTELEATPGKALDANPQYTLPVGQNYLRNSEFAQSLDGWRFSGDTTWVAQGASAPGAARLAIVSKNGGYGADDLSQCVNLGANRVFTMGAKVMIDPASTQQGGGILRLSWFEGEDCQGRSQAGFIEDRVKPVDGWQVLTVDRIEAPPRARSAHINITRGVNDTGLFAYFIDDVYFKALADRHP